VVKARQKILKIAISFKKGAFMILEKYTDKKSPITIDFLKKKCVLPEDTNKLHYHSYHELVIIDKGFVTYAIDSGIIKIAERSIVFMPAHTLHNPFVQKSHPYERYRIRFYDDFSKGIITQPNLLDEALKSSYIKQLKQNDFYEIYSIAENLYKIAIKDSKTEVDRLNECIHLAMLIIKGNNATSIQITPHVSYVTDILEYIKDNYNKPLTIQMLADRFFISKSKLIYDFKNYCRINILEYITMTRIEAAKKYLLKGWSVVATSEACGFSTPSYFIKVFSRITGLTPLKFQMKYVRY